jgi:hypothetical protein
MFKQCGDVHKKINAVVRRARVSGTESQATAFKIVRQPARRIEMAARAGLPTAKKEDAMVRDHPWIIAASVFALAVIG